MLIVHNIMQLPPLRIVSRECCLPCSQFYFTWFAAMDLWKNFHFQDWPVPDYNIKKGNRRGCPFLFYQLDYSSYMSFSPFITCSISLRFMVGASSSMKVYT